MYVKEQSTFYNTKKTKFSVWKFIFFLLGVLLMLNAVIVHNFSNMNLGIIATFLLGAVFLFCALFWDTLVPKIPKWLKYLFIAGVALVIAFAMFLLIYGTSDQVTYHEDAVIVLGSGIKGEKLSVGLKGRLDRAVAYYEKNPNAVIVVSGGQGPQETITESLAMERYLISRGIPQEKIIREENAANTFENFTYSKKLLDERFNSAYCVAFVTSDYHVFRAKSIAKAAGFTDVYSCHSNTRWYALIPCCLRECIGVLRFWILGY